MMFVESFLFFAAVLLGLWVLAWLFGKLCDAIGGQYGESGATIAFFFIICFIGASILTGVRWIASLIM